MADKLVGSLPPLCRSYIKTQGDYNEYIEEPDDHIEDEEYFDDEEPEEDFDDEEFDEDMEDDCDEGCKKSSCSNPKGFI